MPLSPDKVKYLVVHCSATPPNQNIGAAEIDRMHRQRGFFKIGYHFVIRRDGTVETGRRLDEIGAHVEGKNSESIGICLVGGVEKKGHAVRAANGDLVSLVAKDNFTLDQKHALAMQLTGLLHQFPNAEVLGHRDFPGVKKDCPCFDVREWWRSTATHPDLT